MGRAASRLFCGETYSLAAVADVVTYVWQMIAGPTLGVALRRLWPMMLAVCAATWAGLG
jgi:hypothetical protein